ncbi:MAG: class I SAM-dependent methyltransferase [Planctomycetota bacterium]
MGRQGSYNRPKKKPGLVPPEPIRQGYDQLGPASYYEVHQADYRNPHEGVIRKLLEIWFARWRPEQGSKVLDLACGSGEITSFFQASGFYEIEGIDPFTGPAYLQRTGLTAAPHDFSAIAEGVLKDRTYDLIFCSFALHLAERSRLPVVCLRMSEIASDLIVLTPHKRPEIREEWGWSMIQEWLQDRVRLRHYRKSGGNGF